jgi:hypothetical protein
MSEFDTNKHEAMAGRIIENSPNSLLMDESRAAAYLGDLSPKTLQAWRVRGYGPSFIKIGRLIRYSQQSLDLFIQSQVRRSTSESGVTQ